AARAWVAPSPLAPTSRVVLQVTDQAGHTGLAALEAALCRFSDGPIDRWTRRSVGPRREPVALCNPTLHPAPSRDLYLPFTTSRSPRPASVDDAGSRYEPSPILSTFSLSTSRFNDART